jgi:hypothetical protein
LATLREHALQAWAQEQEKQKNTDAKKRKRRAKKIEADIDDLLPRDSESAEYERRLDDPVFGATVSVRDGQDAVLRFTYDEDDNLTLVGKCTRCRSETVSQPVRRLDELGKMLESFEPGDSHNCPQ